MKKNTKRLLCGGCAVVVLGLAYAGLTLLPETEETDDAQTVSLVSMDSDSLASVQVSPSDGAAYTVQFEHDDSGTTYTMSGGEADADYSESLLQELMNHACSISARLVEENCDDLSAYGLSESDTTSSVTITDADEAATRLTFGASNDILDGTYCTVDGGSTVYLLDSDSADSLLQPQTYYRNLTVLGSYYSLSSELESLTIDAMSDGSVVTIQARDTSDMDEEAVDSYSSFVLTQPLSCDADDSTLKSGVLSDLQDAMTAQEIVEDNPTDLSQYGLDTPRAKLRITTNSLDATVLVGDTNADGDGVYLMTEGGSTVFLSTASDFNFLDDDWNDWRSTNLMPCALSELDSITLTQDDMVSEVVLTTVPADENEEEDEDTITATLNGEELSEDALDQLYLAISSVNYVRLVDDPEEDAQAEATLTLTMTDGTTRSLAFTKGGSREYLVSVDGGAFAYGVRQDDLTSILEAFAADDDAAAEDDASE
ncbi:MAG: DUF4340 domain-containing protein [Eubacteriales bacterium]|nr:DUF4340 domain-containing protein [Eubacteriales bacterium]